ncbi:MAG: hypothetical protein HOP33_10300 [Verrucomicrobia bacterium]|nr:hypothetical protein [Verrucomicrobiota bacterium]
MKPLWINTHTVVEFRPACQFQNLVTGQSRHDNGVLGVDLLLPRTLPAMEKPAWAAPKPSPPWRTLERLGKPRKEFAGGEGPQGRASGSERVQPARVLWHLLKYKQPFNPEVFAKKEAKMKRKKHQRLQSLATTLNYRLVPFQ